MHIGIVGAGLIGVSTALELSLRGHRVEVFDQRSGIAAESSFAGAGLWCPTVLPSLGLHPDWRQRAPWNHWARRQAQARKAPVWRERQQTLVRLGQQGQQWLDALTSSHRLEFEQRQGWLILRPDARSLRQDAADTNHLDALGLPYRLLTPKELGAVEPALQLQAPPAGGLYLPEVRVINGRQLAQQLRAVAQQLGTVFHLGTEVSQIVAGRPATLRWQHLGEARSGETRFDAVVLCMGTASSAALQSLGLRLPLFARPGASLTAPLSLPEAMPDPGPQGAVTESTQGLTLSRLGVRVRITAPWLAPDAQGRPSLRAQTRMYAALERWFPEAGHGAQVQAWQGQRASLPDDAPVLGASPWTGVWLNLGHGDQGSALAGGSALALADALQGEAIADDLQLLSCERWR